MNEEGRTSQRSLLVNRRRLRVKPVFRWRTGEDFVLEPTEQREWTREKDSGAVGKGPSVHGYFPVVPKDVQDKGKPWEDFLGGHHAPIWQERQPAPEWKERVGFLDIRDTPNCFTDDDIGVVLEQQCGGPWSGRQKKGIRAGLGKLTSKNTRAPVSRTVNRGNHRIAR